MGRVLRNVRLCLFLFFGLRVDSEVVIIDLEDAGKGGFSLRRIVRSRGNHGEGVILEFGKFLRLVGGDLPVGGEEVEVFSFC